MAEATQHGWTRLRTATGRYEYQFQGEMPSVRSGQYEAARDYQFLILDDEGLLYKIPVRLSSGDCIRTWRERRCCVSLRPS